MRKLPTSPLSALVDVLMVLGVSRSQMGRRIADRIGGNPRSWTRALVRLRHQRGIRFYRADILVTGLGFHPSEIWGREWTNR